MRLTVSQSLSQSSRQAVRQAVSETGKHVGIDTQFGFFGGSLHQEAMVNLMCG